MSEQIPELERLDLAQKRAPLQATDIQPPRRKMVLKRALILLGSLLFVAAVGVALYLLHVRAIAHEVAQARALLGTNQGKDIIARLADKYPNNAEIQFLHCQELALAGGD